MPEESLHRCPGCGGSFPDVTGPTHRYMISSSGCWAAFGRVLALQYARENLRDVHRLAVDAYAAQHPGEPTPASMKSVGVHLIRLYLTLERGYDVRESNRVMVAVAKVKGRFGWLSPPDSLGEITVADVDGILEVNEHRDCVRRWAASAWQAWEPHHATVRAWAEELVLP